MSDRHGEHLGRRHLDPKHARGDWWPARGHHTSRIDPSQVDGHPLGRAARQEGSVTEYTRRTLRTLATIAAVILCAMVLAIVIGDLGELQGWW